jgi:hypothetical protein
MIGKKSDNRCIYNVKVSDLLVIYCHTVLHHSPVFVVWDFESLGLVRKSGILSQKII